MLFYVDNALVDAQYFRDILQQSLENHFADTSDYDQMIDDVYGSIEIFGYRYDASSIIKEFDSYSYDEGFNEFVENETENWFDSFEMNELEDNWDGHYFESRNDDNPIEDAEEENEPAADDWFAE